MKTEEFLALKPGDVIRNVNAIYGYMVTANFHGRVTAVRTADVTNPDEWDLIQKAGEDSER